MTTSKSLPLIEADGASLVSRVWVQVAALVLLCGLAILGFLGYRAYTSDPPIAGQVLTPAGQLVYTGADVIAGQQLFLRKGLMEYGSIFGHGAYLGPDFTADYLHRAAEIATREYGGDTSGTARAKVIADFKTNRYDPSTDAVTYTYVQAKAFEELFAHYTSYFGPESASQGLLPEAITDPVQVRQLTAYFSWSAWAGSTLRPDKAYSYTNNWPSEPLVGNTITADAVVWSVLSLIVLLAGIGILFAAFGRWGERMGWRGRQADTISFRRPGDVAVTPTQRTAWSDSPRNTRPGTPSTRSRPHWRSRPESDVTGPGSAHPRGSWCLATSSDFDWAISCPPMRVYSPVIRSRWTSPR